MLKISHKAVISAAAAVMLTACVDDDYDLSNLDTTVKVNVNELIIPVNIDEVLLSDILKLDQEDHVEIVDGFPRVGQRSSGEVLRRFGEYGFRHVWRGLRLASELPYEGLQYVPRHGPHIRFCDEGIYPAIEQRLGEYGYQYSFLRKGT